jgi:hypothetical protein
VFVFALYSLSYVGGSRTGRRVKPSDCDPHPIPTAELQTHFSQGRATVADRPHDKRHNRQTSGLKTENHRTVPNPARVRIRSCLLQHGVGPAIAAESVRDHNPHSGDRSVSAVVGVAGPEAHIEEDEEERQAVPH